MPCLRPPFFAPRLLHVGFVISGDDEGIDVEAHAAQHCRMGNYIVSVHRMVMKNRPVDPGSIQGSHRYISS